MWGYVGDDMDDVTYGRTDEEWDLLTREGLRYLIEQARLVRTTSYTEMNTVLPGRTELPAFDFEHAAERAAMGHLLYRIVREDFAESQLMVSALVVYLNSNDAGDGFYKLATEMRLMPKGASETERVAFWTGQVTRLHARHRRPRRSAST